MKTGTRLFYSAHDPKSSIIEGQLSCAAMRHDYGVLPKCTIISEEPLFYL